MKQHTHTMYTQGKFTQTRSKKLVVGGSAAVRSISTRSSSRDPRVWVRVHIHERAHFFRRCRTRDPPGIFTLKQTERLMTNKSTTNRFLSFPLLSSGCCSLACFVFGLPPPAALRTQETRSARSKTWERRRISSTRLTFRTTRL